MSKTTGQAARGITDTDLRILVDRQGGYWLDLKDPNSPTLNDLTSGLVIMPAIVLGWFRHKEVDLTLNWPETRSRIAPSPRDGFVHLSRQA